MNEIKPREYEVLDELARNPLATQAGLSEKIGVAVGSVNWYIKRLIQRGWVKVSHLDRTRLKYDLTPEGMKVFTRRALSYARDSLKVYAELREKAREIVRELRRSEIAEVYVEGRDEMADILKLTCIEAGIRVADAPGEVILKSAARGYRIVRKASRHE